MYHVYNSKRKRVENLEKTCKQLGNSLQSAKQSEEISMDKGYWALCEIESSLVHKVEELLREKNRLLTLRMEQLRHGYDVPSYTDGLDIRISTIQEILIIVANRRNNLAEQEIENLKKQMENSEA